MILGVVWFILAILTVVMVHEAGHLIAAKAFDFKATKFFVGFGPRLWSFKKGETEYGIAAIPAGGFVKIVGMNPYEEVPEADKARSYPNKPAWQRAIVLLAGSATHWPVAFLMLLIGLMTVPTAQATNEIAVVGREIDGQVVPAAAAGLKAGDIVLEVNGRPIAEWEDTRAAIRATGAGETLTMLVQRDGEEQQITAELGTAVLSELGEPVAYFPPGTEVPEEAVPEGGEAAPFLGVEPDFVMETQALVPAARSAGGYVVEITSRSFTGMSKIFTSVFGGELWREIVSDGERDPEGAMGLVGAGRIAGESVEEGRLMYFLGLVATFTIFVGLMNLLPLPPLDGGHLAVLVWEKVTGKKVDIRKLIPVAAAVIAFFLVLFVAVLYLDIARPIQSPF